MARSNDVMVVRILSVLIAAITVCDCFRWGEVTRHPTYGADENRDKKSLSSKEEETEREQRSMENSGGDSRMMADEPQANEPCMDDADVIDKLLKAGNYSKLKVPGKLVEVEVEVWVQEITTISDITSDFLVDIYISEKWLDPGLVYEYFRPKPCKHNISLNRNEYDRIWTPNTCFINSKTAEIHKSPFENIFLMVYNNGTVWTNYRMVSLLGSFSREALVRIVGCAFQKLTGPCKMRLKQFPFDTVSCWLTFESFSKSS